MGTAAALIITASKQQLNVTYKSMIIVVGYNFMANRRSVNRWIVGEWDDKIGGGVGGRWTQFFGSMGSLIEHDDRADGDKPEEFLHVWNTEPNKGEIEEFVMAHMSYDDTIAFIAAYKDAELQYFEILYEGTWKRYLNTNRVALALNRRNKGNFGSGGGDGSIGSLPADALDLILGFSLCNFPILLV